MARTTHAAVIEILGDDWNGSRSTTPYIQSVTGLVTRVATESAARGFTFATAALEVLERWLSAWAYALSDKPLTQKGSGRASGSFAGTTEKGLDANLYGQFAKTLDPSGALVALTSGRVAGIQWLGRPPSEQTDYDDRD